MNEAKEKKRCPLCGKPIVGLHYVEAKVYHMPCMMEAMRHHREKE